jgi:hypothetical protein
MNRCRRTFIHFWIALSITGGRQVFCQVQTAPPSLAATLIIKLAAFEKRIAGSGEVSIFVLGDPQTAVELQKGVGTLIGQSKLMRVASGTGLPKEKPSILFVGSRAKWEDAVAYTRANKILRATANPDWVGRGVTLGMGVGNDGKPKIWLNLTSAAEENLDWNPAILKIAKTVQ